MVDRILHIGHKFSNRYDKELLQRAATVYINTGYRAVAPHLVRVENMDAAEAETLARNINREMLKVNRQVLLLYVVIFLIFLFITAIGLKTRSYIFAALFALPTLRLLYSIIKFMRRNPLQ